MTVRVIRVLEYEYEDQASANLDMSRWGVPPMAIHRPNKSVIIRSAVILPYDERDS